jgi:bifunctional non-homologous end joining protein LigD
MSALDPFAALSDADRQLLKAQALPTKIAPMKAKLTTERFSDERWVFERKLDGIRCLATAKGESVRLASRTGLSLNDRFPELVAALRHQRASALAVDGEIVAFRGSQTSFERLQQRGRERVPVFLYLFDLLHLDGQDTTALPLLRRKALLRTATVFGGPVRFTPHRRRDGEKLFREACAHGWEGLIAKRIDAPYTHGRSADWLKFKCSAEQELVVGGYTSPRGSRAGLGALLLGYYDKPGRLRYAGKVGTGFTQTELRDLSARLEPLRRASAPFVDDVREGGVRWVDPELVAQVAFSEWTRQGRLRHPRYLGLRDDKAASEVVRE